MYILAVCYTNQQNVLIDSILLFENILREIVFNQLNESKHCRSVLIEILR